MKLVMFISYYFSKKTDLGFPVPQRFGETFAHHNKC